MQQPGRKQDRYKAADCDYLPEKMIRVFAESVAQTTGFSGFACAAPLRKTNMRQGYADRQALIEGE